jgi:[ribosomal protein S5]-alanine N-acetyltransferase
MESRPFPELRTARFRLRRIVPADIDAVFRGLSDPAVIAHYGVSYETLEATQRQMDWFEEIHAAGTGTWWGISEPAPGAPLIGACGLNDIQAEHRRGELGYWLMPECWGHGIAAECVGAMLEHAWGPMALHRVAAEVEVENHASRRVLDRLGFRLEGIRRDYERKHGSFIDLMIYARLATDAVATNPNALGVRVASAADASRIAPLFDAYRQFYGLPSDRSVAQRYLAERLALGESVLLVAEAADGTALGFVQMYPTFSSLRAARTFVLHDLYVDPAARRGGVARRLMEAAVTQARAAGAVALTLQTARANDAAQRLYEALGWKRDEEFWEYGLRLDPPAEGRQ